MQWFVEAWYSIYHLGSFLVDLEQNPGRYNRKTKVFFTLCLHYIESRINYCMDCLMRIFTSMIQWSLILSLPFRLIFSRFSSEFGEIQSKNKSFVNIISYKKFLCFTDFNLETGRTKRSVKFSHLHPIVIKRFSYESALFQHDFHP